MTTDDFYMIIGELYVAQRVGRNDLETVSSQFKSLQEIEVELQSRLKDAEDHIELLEQRLAKKKGGNK
jgi:prefoldin subunit 5